MKGAITAPAYLRTSTSPIAVRRTKRLHAATGITSLPAGKMVPIFAAPLLREDAVRSGNVRFAFESMETAEMLMNPINVKVMAYVIPTLALERFKGSMDLLNRSWEGKGYDNEPVVPFVETAVYGPHGENQIYKYLGLHARSDQMVNTMYLEAYNLLWNFRAKNRSADLYESAKRERLDKTLAPAFWMHERFKHIVPDFDQAKIDGQVAFNVVNEKLPVRGIAYTGSNAAQVVDTTVGVVRDKAGKDYDGAVTYNRGVKTSVDGAFTINTKGIVNSGTNGATSSNLSNVLTDIYAELSGVGISLSLSNIELAKKTAAYANLRAAYSGHDEEYIINMLMDGLSIPDQAYKQPILIAERQTVFGMSKRYASDGANLTESVVNGATFIDMSLQIPRIPMGGVILVVAEILPDQLFERQKDAFFHAQNADDFPRYLRDELDPEKVAVVKCDDVDVDHDRPNDTFGYAPLNWQWNIEQPHIGGYFFRPKVDAGFNEDRQRIWANETVNPTLSKDFYICTNIHQKVFVVTNRDPFECVTQGTLVIEGNTVFGGALLEANGDYDAVYEKAPQERIVK